MKLQKFPLLAAALLGALWVSTPDLWAHGGGFRAGGGGFRAGGGGFRAGGGVVGGRGVRTFSGARGFGAVRAPGFVGPSAGFGRFNRFDHRGFAHRRGFNNVIIAGGGYGYPFPYYGGSPYFAPGSPVAPADYAAPDSGFAPPVVASQNPGLVAGDVVGNVQRVLKYRGFYRGPIDGLSGPATRAAIRAYDASVGLPPTGMIDARLLLSMQLM